MELTYIFHSSFVLETSQCILVFDYWMDPGDILRQHIKEEKPIYVFASHFHADHFNHKIFEFKEQYPNNQITYVLSKDILKHRRAQKDEAQVWLAKGGGWEDKFLKVIATGSNDSGVSWIVETDGKRIFHAGDLCNWYARFLCDGTPADAVISGEFGNVCPAEEEKKYLGELKDIAKVRLDFDIAMFPVDGRIGNGYTLGARQFIERFEVGLFVPMHFITGGFESAWRMEPFCRKKDIAFWAIKAEGETLQIP